MAEVKITARGEVFVASQRPGGISMRSTAIERVRRRALEKLDPFSHGGYQPETPTEPASDPVVEIDMLEEARRIARLPGRQILQITARKISD